MYDCLKLFWVFRKFDYNVDGNVGKFLGWFLSNMSVIVNKLGLKFFRYLGRILEEFIRLLYIVEKN